MINYYKLNPYKINDKKHKILQRTNYFVDLACLFIG